MGKKLLLFLICGSIGALAYGWWINRSAIALQHEQALQRFVNAGPRFTAQDGQVLCERVKALESHSYGFANAGLKPLSCEYASKK